jgi:hypothetical protein
MSAYMEFNEATAVDLEKWRLLRDAARVVFDAPPPAGAEFAIERISDARSFGNRKQRRATLAKMRRGK